MKRTFFTLLIALAALGIVSRIIPALAEEPVVPRPRVAGGDVNGDGKRDITDIIYFLRYLFLDGPAPIEPEDDSVDPALLARVQEGAARVLESFPSPERIAALPTQISGGFARARQVFEAAAADALTWQKPELERYVASVQWVAVLIPISTAYICNIHPELCVDEECAERCEAAYNGCAMNCLPSGSPSYLPCVLDCTMARFECSLDCVNW